jgi:hypothetical protein
MNCSLKERADNFIKRATQIHGDRYDYSKVEYSSLHEKVVIICPDHGVFLQSPNGHVNNGSGCPLCDKPNRVVKYGAIKRDPIEVGSLRQCSRCRNFFNLSNFASCKNTKDGLSPDCSICRAESERKWVAANRNRVLEGKREKSKLLWKKYKEENLDEFIVRLLKRVIIARENRINDKLTRRLRSYIRDAVAMEYRSCSAINLLGCDLISFKKHIESQWTDGMSWENHNYWGWHLDHIRPCASFDLKDPKQQSKCFHYTNLQPLWAYENLSKGAKILKSYK